MNNIINDVVFNELNIHKINNKINTSIYDIYPDFDWVEYRRLNPYLYFMGLNTKEQYIENYLIEGRYKGRIYKEPHKSLYSIHVLMATIGKKKYI